MAKQLKLLIIVALGILTLGGILLFAEPKGTTQPSQSQTSININVEPKAWDFGTISMKDGLVNKSFTLNNQEATELLLSSLYTSCMCTTTKIIIAGQEYGPFGMAAHGGNTRLNQKLSVAQNAELIVTFDPNAHGPSGIGPIERVVTIETSGGEKAEIKIKANVIP